MFILINNENKTYTYDVIFPRFNENKPEWEAATLTIFDSIERAAMEKDWIEKKYNIETTVIPFKEYFGKFWAL